MLTWRDTKLHFVLKYHNENVSVRLSQACDVGDGSHRVSDPGSPVLCSFKAVRAALIIPDRLSDLFFCGHYKWT